MAGNIRIIEPTSKYQKVCKGIILDKEIDPFTLGIYVKVVALGKEWELNISGFASYTGITETKVRKAFAQLEKEGFIRRVRVKDVRTGHFIGWDYEIGIDHFPEDQRTDIAKTRPSENPNVGKTELRKNRTSENVQVYNKDYIEIKTKKEDKTLFNYREAVIGLGVSPEIVDTWLEVRRRAKAVNSEIAFKDLCTEIAKAGQPAEECIRIAAANSWRGFRAEYLRPRNLAGTAPRRESVYQHNARVLAEVQQGIINDAL